MDKLNLKEIAGLSQSELVDYMRRAARDMCQYSLERIISETEKDEIYLFHTFNGFILAFYSMDLISEAQMQFMF